MLWSWRVFQELVVLQLAVVGCSRVLQIESGPPLRAVPAPLRAVPASLPAALPAARATHLGHKLVALLDADCSEEPKRWAGAAKLLRDWAADGGPHAETVQACESVLATTRERAPDLYSVAKLSAKRNGRLAARADAADRCLAELGVLATTYAALAGAEREAFLADVRPVAQTLSSSARLRAFVLLAGVHTPGTKHLWRPAGHAAELAARRASRGGLAVRPQSERGVSRALRGAYPLLDETLHAWLADTDPDAGSAGELLDRLANATPAGEGVRLAQAIAAWAADALVETLEAKGPPESLRDAPDAARLLAARHAAHVAGKTRARKRWREALARVGHGVWLLLLTARRHAGSEHLVPQVRGVLLACALLERSDDLRPQYRAALSRADTQPERLLELLGTALLPGRALSVAEVAEAVAGLLSWPNPELIFKYLAIHAEDDELAALAERWVAALLGVGNETVSALRCAAAPNARHFARLRASSAAGARAVALWIAADAGEVALPGTTDPATLFLLGEELGSCLRITRECAAQNRALLGLLAQGDARILRVTEQGRFGAGQRTAVRATAWLLGRAKDAAPVLFVDQPLFGHFVEAERKEEVLDALLAEAASLAEVLGVPVAFWTSCTGDLEHARNWEGRVALVEFDGLAPAVYTNLRGVVPRGELGMRPRRIRAPPGLLLEDSPGCIVHALWDPTRTPAPPVLHASAGPEKPRSGANST